MNTKELLKKREEYLKEIERFKEGVDKKFTQDIKAFHKANISVEEEKVYEIESGGKPPRGFKRFVVYGFQNIYFSGSVIVKAWGWWLNEENVPTKWKGLVIHGTADNVKLRLSENQNAEKHPDAK